MVIKPMTVPSGWKRESFLVNEEARWYSGSYVNEATGVRQHDPPLGTQSFCEMLSEDEVTKQFVGRPTVFVSHAWGSSFLELLDALISFEGFANKDGAETFFWIGPHCIGCLRACMLAWIFACLHRVCNLALPGMRCFPANVRYRQISSLLTSTSRTQQLNFTQHW